MIWLTWNGVLSGFLLPVCFLPRYRQNALISALFSPSFVVQSLHQSLEGTSFETQEFSEMAVPRFLPRPGAESSPET